MKVVVNLNQSRENVFNAIKSELKIDDSALAKMYFEQGLNKIAIACGVNK